MLDLTTSPNSAREIDLLAPFEVIETMIDLRIQLTQLEQQIQALQPAFLLPASRSIKPKLNAIVQSSRADSLQLNGLTQQTFFNRKHCSNSFVNSSNRTTNQQESEKPSGSLSCSWLSLPD